MKKIIKINGMSCANCQAHVEKALNSIDGIEAKVELKKNRAIASYSKEIEDKVIEDAITEAGYELVSIKEKKGLFG